MNQKKEILYCLYQWSVLFLAICYFLIPYSPNRSFEVLGKNFFVTQILILFSSVLLVVSLIFSNKLKEHLKNLSRFKKVTIPFVLSLSVIALSTVVNIGFTGNLFSRLFSVFVIFLVTMLFSLLSQKFIDRLLAITAGFTIVASILGVLQYFGDRVFSPAFYLTGRGESYAVGFANYSSLFALHLSSFLVIYWILFLLNYKGKKNLWGLTFFFGIVPLILTFSRGAWLALIVGIPLLYWLMTEYRDKQKKIFISLVLATLISVITLASSIYPTYLSLDSELETTHISYKSQEIINNRFSITDKSTTSRGLFHKVALSMIFDNSRNFFIGLGQWGYYDAWPEYNFRPELEGRKNIDPHSTFLEILTAGGILSFGLFLIFLLYLFRTAWIRRKQNVLIVPFLAAFSTVLINGLTHTHLYTKYSWIILGLTLSLIALREENPEDKSKENMYNNV